MSSLNTVVSLLNKVERPPGEEIPGGMSAAELDDAENRIGFELPASFRTWLMATNGPCVGPGGLVGIAKVRKLQDLESIYALHPSWREKHWVPIAGDGCGNYYVMVPGNGDLEPIVFIDTFERADTPAFVVASQLWYFLVFLLQKDLFKSGWPFDRNEVLKADPQIANTHLALPWDA